MFNLVYLKIDQKEIILWTRDEKRRLSGERIIMQGTTPGARKQGKPRMRWMDNMEEWTGMPFEDLLKKTRDRKKWSTLVMKRPTLGARMVEDKTRLKKCIEMIIFVNRAGITKWTIPRTSVS